MKIEKVNPRVEKAIEAFLDFCDLIMTPRRWPTDVRRVYVLLFPVSFPILGVISILIMVAVLLLAMVCGAVSGLFSLSDYLKKLWEDAE